MADAMMMFLGEAHGVNWYWAQPGEFENPGVYYWDGAKNVLCVPHLAAAPEAPAPVANGVATVEDSQPLPLGGFRIHAKSAQPMPVGASLHLHAQQPAPPSTNT